MVRLIMIVNPRSGLRRGRGILERVRPVFARAGVTLEVLQTDHAGQGGERVEFGDLDRADGICVIGGDGTFHEILNAMLRRGDGERRPLGLIPGGTGNALAHDLGTPGPLEAAERIAGFRPLPLDVMKIECQGMDGYAFNLVAFGIMAGANTKAERLRALGRRRYDAAALWEIVFHRHHAAVLTVEREPPRTGDYAFIAGLNTVHAGFGMKAAPRARLDDGKLDLLVVGRARRRELIGMLSGAYSGRHVESPRMEYRQATSFTIATPRPQPLNIDGETKGSTPVRVMLAPGAVRLL